MTARPRALPSTLLDVAAVDGAHTLNALLETLHDMEKQRIAKDDAAVLRKGVIALLGVVGELEARVHALELRSVV